MIENFSATFSSLIFSFCVVAIISVPTSFKLLCNFLLYFSCRKNAVGTTENFYPYTYPKKKILWATTKIFSHLSKGKTTPGYALKILYPHFSCRKIGCSNTLKIENLQNVQIPESYPQKESRQRTVRSSACCSIYFRNRNRIVRSRFRLSYFATVLIQVSARTLPSSAAMQIEIRL